MQAWIRSLQNRENGKLVRSSIAPLVEKHRIMFSEIYRSLYIVFSDYRLSVRNTEHNTFIIPFSVGKHNHNIIQVHLQCERHQNPQMTIP